MSPKYDAKVFKQLFGHFNQEVAASLDEPATLEGQAVQQMSKASYDSMDARARLCQELRTGLEPLLDLTVKAVHAELSYAPNETVNPEDIRVLMNRLNDAMLAVLEMQSRIYETLRRM